MLKIDPGERPSIEEIVGLKMFKNQSIIMRILTPVNFEKSVKDCFVSTLPNSAQSMAIKKNPVESSCYENSKTSPSDAFKSPNAPKHQPTSSMTRLMTPIRKLLKKRNNML
jgi:hypothetical protein